MYKVVNGEQVKLTPEEQLKLETEWAENKAKQEAFDAQFGYRANRKDEYPPIGDQLDAILKYFTKPNNIESDGKALKKIIEQWKAVKKKYPKPRI